MRVLEKITENSKQLDRQARPGFEPGTSRLPVLSVTAVPLVGLVIRGNFVKVKAVQGCLCYGFFLFFLDTSIPEIPKC